MSDTQHFDDQIVNWKRFVRDHWSRFDSFARRCHEVDGPGAITINISLPADQSFFESDGYGYLTKEASRGKLSAVSQLTFTMWVGDYNPREKVVFWLWDSESGRSKVWVQHKCEDGSPLPDPDLDWYKKERICPTCAAVFVSVQRKGQCPCCGHTFFATPLGG